MAEQRVKKSHTHTPPRPCFPGQNPSVWAAPQAVEQGVLATSGPQPADWINLFHPEKHLVHDGRRGLQARSPHSLERDVFVSWLHTSISNVWASPFLPEVALLGKVQATPLPPVPKQKVCDEEKLLQVKCSQDPSCPSLRMPRGCWCCSRLHHEIAPACPSLQGASCSASASLGTSQPAESICRVQTADSSAWGGPQGSQWISQVQRGGTVLGQRLDPCVQAETLCNGAGEVKNNFSSFCLRTDCLHLYKSSYVYSAVAWCSSSAHEKLK